MNRVRLTKLDNSNILINTNNIMAFHSIEHDEKDATEVILTDETKFVVAETVDEVDEAISLSLRAEP